MTAATPVALPSVIFVLVIVLVVLLLTVVSFIETFGKLTHWQRLQRHEHQGLLLPVGLTAAAVVTIHVQSRGL